jgi:O-antigen ligase
MHPSGVPSAQSVERYSTMNLSTMSKDTSRLVAALTAIVVTVAAFAKIFVPFYLIGSTPIFVTSCFFGLLLIAFASRKLVKQTTYATEVLVLLILFYSTVVASFLINSLHRVPITHLLGILIFHGVFLLFGFAAARSLKAIFAVLLAGAAIYILVIVQYVLRFGDLMQAGYLHDVFGAENPVVTVTFHQNIGSVLAIATLAATGLGWTRGRRVAFAALPLVFLFLFYIAARTAIVALAGSLLFFAGAALWGRSRRLAVAGFAAVMLTAAVASTVFYERALQDEDVDAVAPDAISRTIREIQDPRPLFRMQIWTRAIHRIAAEPDRLLLGHGVGIYPIDEGFGAPDWLLRPAEGNKYYPHNLHLELLYETGIPGFLIFTALTLLPLFFSLKHWDRLSAPERAAIALYVFYLVSVEISGSFAYSYDFQFFFGLAAGVVALKRMELTEIGKIATPPNESPLPNFGKSPA